MILGVAETDGLRIARRDRYLINLNNMYLEANINDTYTAGQAWLRRQIEIDELSLPDPYPRPLKAIERSKRKWSFINLIRSILP